MTRSGWNTRGGSDLDHFRIAQAMAKTRAALEAVLVQIQQIVEEAEYAIWYADNITPNRGRPLLALMAAESKLKEVKRDEIPGVG